MFSSHLHHLIDPYLAQCHSKRKYPYFVIQFNNNRMKSVWRWGKSQKVIYFFVLSQFVECLEDCLPLLLQANTTRSRTNPLGLVALLLLSLANGQKRQHQSNPLLFFAPSFFCLHITSLQWQFTYQTNSQYCTLSCQTLLHFLHVFKTKYFFWLSQTLFQCTWKPT